MAHCPSYKPTFGLVSLSTYEACLAECETGYRYREGRQTRTPILPEEGRVLYSLLRDASAIDHPDFESWASELGFDTDSRKAEAMYRECLACGLALHAALGHDALEELQEAAQDY